MKALISIDCTNAFITTDGALTTGLAGQSIEEEIVNVARAFIEQGNFVVIAIDAHQPDDRYHPENKLFPSHNIIGTEGQDLYSSLKQLYAINQFNPQVY
ncbi:cysteine hydrolase family protein [Snodgrassella gandavensis]|uniref:cysteine hydrolase family protein n=1 Tax=Snodgrassella gandavensis TaxID=2946698 RepID=UPI0030B82128